MKIANICTVTTFNPFYNALEEKQLWVIRKYALTAKGAERVINKQRKRLGYQPVNLTRLETAIIS
jgi:hypothetical protein